MIPEGKTKDKVKLLTYNIQMVPWVVTQTSDEYPTSGMEERLNDVVKCFEPFDVIHIQEAYSGLWS